SDASSAVVTGDWSTFVRRTTVDGETTSISAQARATTTVKSSRSRVASAGRISEPDVKFHVLLLPAVLGGGLGAVYHLAKSPPPSIRPEWGSLHVQRRLVYVGIFNRSARSCRLVVFACLPRSHQSGRRYRERA